MPGYVHALHAVDEAMRVAIPSPGADCRFVGDNGTEVEGDLAACGSEVFDLWWLRGYGLGLPETVDVTDEDLRSAVQSLHPLPTEVQPGWCSVAN